MHCVIVFLLKYSLSTVLADSNYFDKKTKLTNEDLKYEVRYILGAFAHGYRTPSEQEMLFLKKKIERNKFEPYGLGVQTPEGNSLLYKVGSLLNLQYGDLNDEYGFLPGHVTIRCTDHTYTKISALITMAALTKMFETDNYHMNFEIEPIIYSHREKYKDDLLYYKNCPKYKELQQLAYTNADDDYRDAMKEVCEEVFSSVNKYSKEQATTLEDIMTFDNLMRGLKFINMTPPWFDKSFEEKVLKCVKYAYQAEFTYKDLIRLANGVALSELHHLLNVVMTNMSKISIVPVTTYLVAGHPRTVASWLAGAGVLANEIPNWQPKYGSVVIFLVVYYPSLNEYGIKVFYMADPEIDEKFAEMHVRGCEYVEYCKLTNFIKNTKEFLMTRVEFEKECGMR